MQNRRFTRLTDGFSRKLANHCHMIALYTVWHNFVKMHRTSMTELVALVDAFDAAQPRKRPGRKPKGAAA
jgi:hypothetical protein